MKKDVLVSIKGLHFSEEADSEQIEVITPGSYYRKKNHHYVVYEEVAEGSDEVTKNMIKFDGDTVSIIKKGYTTVDMLFEKNKRNMTNYVTPFGSLMVGVDAKDINIDCGEDNISINVDYALDINYQHLADCKIEMAIKSISEDAIALN